MDNKIKVLLNVTCGLIIFIGGYQIGHLTNKNNAVYGGNLRIDTYEEDEPPKIFLELTNIDSINEKNKNIVLKIIRKNYVAK